MKKAEGAKTAQELKEKYGKKRYNPQNIWLAYMAQYLYGLYLRNEGVTFEEQKDEKYNLFNRHTRIKHAQILATLDGDNLKQYHYYDSTLSWVIEKFRYAVLVRDSTVRDFLAFGLLLKDTLSAEKTLDKAREAHIDSGITQELADDLSIKAYREGSQRYRALDMYDTIITANLKYIFMYNTYIEILSKCAGVPELTIFKVSVDSVEESREDVNGFIKELRKEAGGKATETEETIFFKELVDIQPAPPIPEKLLKKIINDTKKYGEGYDGFNNLLNCYYYGKGLDAYTYG